MPFHLSEAQRLVNELLTQPPQTVPRNDMFFPDSIERWYDKCKLLDWHLGQADVFGTENPWKALLTTEGDNQDKGRYEHIRTTLNVIQEGLSHIEGSKTAAESVVVNELLERATAAGQAYQSAASAIAYFLFGWHLSRLCQGVGVQIGYSDDIMVYVRALVNHDVVSHAGSGDIADASAIGVRALRGDAGLQIAESEKFIQFVKKFCQDHPLS